MQFALPMPKKIKTINFKELLQLYREPMVTLLITPCNAPEVNNDYRNRKGGRNYGSFNNDFDWEDDTSNQKQTSDMVLNKINGLFSKFYLPEKMRILPNGIRIKLNDIVSYKCIISNKQMKFYLTVPKRWKDEFESAVRRDWKGVDVNQIEEKFIEFSPSKTRVMDVHLRHHYALAVKHEKRPSDAFYESIASMASTLGDEDKVLIDYNITPISESWKPVATKKIKQFKEGKFPNRDDALTMNGIIGRVLDMFNTVFDECIGLIEEIMGTEKKGEEKKEQFFDLKYSDGKTNANSQGYKMQIRVLSESNDMRKSKHILRNIENSFELLNGDNQFIVTHIKSKRGIKSMIKKVEDNKPQMTKTPDIFFEKEIESMLKIPSKQTLKDFSNVIPQDNFTRNEIDEDFFNDEDGAIPFASTLEKVPRKIYFGGYKREWWSKSGIAGRLAKSKTRLDDRCTAVLCCGKQGSGKTQLAIIQALYSFGVHLPKEEWKEKSKSVVVFDVADGEMIRDIYNYIPDWLKPRLVILNHGNFNNPIPVNNADLAEFNEQVMQDDDYASTLSGMEAKLILGILESDKTSSIDRWFISSLQACHIINKDWGYIEAIKTLIDDDFRATEVIPFLNSNRRLKVEMETFHRMATSGKATQIIQTIENRFSQLERDQKLWDCIASRPLRDENGKVKLNFRKLMDGDEDGAYMILIHIPKSGVSELYRKFIFAQYFTKIWSVALSRDSVGREYRPETLVVIDEIHQILGIPLIAELFIDLFKEPRKYSLRIYLTLHGFSSLATAGKAYESKIRQSILDNGANIILLKGGSDSYEKLSEFLQPFTVADFNNLMKMPFTGIFSIQMNSQMHVMQGRLPKPVHQNKDFKKYSNLDTEFLTKFKSDYGVDKKIVREDNLNRSLSLIEGIDTDFDFEVGDDE
jgi:hypothetical protein